MLRQPGVRGLHDGSVRRAVDRRFRNPPVRASLREAVGDVSP
jgi:hypothetical protein